MAAVEIELELTGLKFKFKGERNDILAARTGFENQLGGLIAPALAVGNGKPTAFPNNNEVTASFESIPNGSSSKTRSSRKSSSSKDSPVSTAIDWQFDPEKWGGPKQEWNPTKKSLWLLLVLSEDAGKKNLTPGVIAATFNKHFQEAGLIKGYNVSRDLKKVKSKLVSEDTTQNSSTWSLLQAGIVEARKLVEVAKGNVNGTN